VIELYEWKIKALEEKLQHLKDKKDWSEAK